MLHRSTTAIISQNVRRLVAISACAGIIAVPTAVCAQDGIRIVAPPTGGEMHVQSVTVGVSDAAMQGGGSYQPIFNRQRFQQYADLFGLEGISRELATTLYDDYLQSFRLEASAAQAKQRETIQQAIADAGSGGRGGFEFNEAMAEQLRDLSRAWTQQRDRMNEEMLLDLKSILTDEQLELWETFERERRRHELLPAARLSGESADIIDLVKAMDLPDDVMAAINRHLEQYTVDMDHLLRARENTLNVLRPRFSDATGDVDAMEDIWAEATRRRVGVRDLNRRTVMMLSAELSQLVDDAAGRALTEAFERASFSMAFEATRAERALEMAAGFEDLSEDQRKMISAVEQQYRDRAGRLSRQFIDLMLRVELDMPPYLANMRRIEGGAFVTSIAFETGTLPENPYQELSEQRQQLSNSIVQQVEAVLTPEQRERIPARSEQYNPMRVIRGLGPGLL